MEYNKIINCSLPRKAILELPLSAILERPHLPTTQYVQSLSEPRLFQSEAHISSNCVWLKVLKIYPQVPFQNILFFPGTTWSHMRPHSISFLPMSYYTLTRKPWKFTAVWAYTNGCSPLNYRTHYPLLLLYIAVLSFPAQPLQEAVFWLLTRQQLADVCLQIRNSPSAPISPAQKSFYSLWLLCITEYWPS